MKTTRVCYTVNRKNPLVWLSALLALAALGGFLWRAFLPGAARGFWPVCLRLILPALGACYFAWQLLIHGRDRLYRLSLPFWLLVPCGVWLAGTLAWYWAVGAALAALVSAVLLHRSLDGRLGTGWPVLLIPGLWLCGFFLLGRHAATDLSPAWLAWVPELLLLGAYLPLRFSMKRAADGEYHPTWGDRPDGRRIRSLSPISVVGTYIMPERNQANVFFHDKVEITALEKYIRAKRAQGYDQFGMTEALLAAYVRTVSKYPGANRFISGEKIYSRGRDLQFCMTVKKDMTMESPDTVIKVHLAPGDTVDEVYRKFHATLSDAKKSMELDSGVDGAAAFFGMIPGVLLKFVVWFLKLLDYFGLLPGLILELSPFHGSIFFTSMGSLGIPACFHHLYNFGNLPIFLAFGRKYRANEVDDKGQTVSRKYMDYTFNVDERIVDGFYYATLVKYFQKLLLHPEHLDDPEMEVNEDIP